MKIDLEWGALLVSLVSGSCLVYLFSGIDILVTLISLIPALFLLYLAKYMFRGADIIHSPITKFHTRELVCVFGILVVVKTFIYYGLKDFLVSVLSSNSIEFIVVSLELLSLAALIILLAKPFLKVFRRIFG